MHGDKRLREELTLADYNIIRDSSLHFAAPAVAVLHPNMAEQDLVVLNSFNMVVMKDLGTRDVRATVSCGDVVLKSVVVNEDALLRIVLLDCALLGDELHHVRIFAHPSGLLLHEQAVRGPPFGALFFDLLFCGARLCCLQCERAALPRAALPRAALPALLAREWPQVNRKQEQNTKQNKGNL
jgi:hypothetical protein